MLINIVIVRQIFTSCTNQIIHYKLPILYENNKFLVLQKY